MNQDVYNNTDVQYDSYLEPEFDPFAQQVLASTAITSINGITGPTVTFAGGTSGFSFVPGGTTITLLSPITTKGDLYTWETVAGGVRLGVGANGDVLTADSTVTKGIKWAPPATAGTVTGTGTAGRVAFWDAASNITSDADLTFATDTLTATKIVGSTSVTIGAGSAITSSGAGGAIGTAAFKSTGTSGNTVPLLDGANTFSASQIINATSTSVRGLTVSGGADATVGANATSGQIYVGNDGANLSLGYDANTGFGYIDSVWNSNGSHIKVRTKTSGTAVICLDISGAGNVAIGSAALATNATDGFLYIPSCAGTPTGTPTTFTGRVAMIYDTSNKKLYIYNGAWESATFA